MQLTKNFTDAEFRCPCCNNIKYDMQLVDKLQILRNILATPITITSGYRCIHQNLKVGGYSKSLHMVGIAADIKVKQELMGDLKRLAPLVFYNNGVGIYPNHVHVDMGLYQRFIGKY